MTERPTHLHPDIEIIISSVHDGSMSSGGGTSPSPEHTKNADRFLMKHNFPIERSRVYVTYGTNRSYTDIYAVDDDTIGSSIESDALYTTAPGRVIALPVADCVATVVYDPVAQMLGVLHLGRHSSVAGLIEAFVIDVADAIGSDTRDWYIWMSPSIRKAHDRLQYFTPPNPDEWLDYTKTGDDGMIHIDTIGHNTARFLRAGVAADRIVISPHDTYSDRQFYSQRAYTETGDSSRLGRMMVAARIRV